MNEWITTAEAAEFLKVSRRHVTELARQGKLRARRKGKNWLIHNSLSAAGEEVKEVPQGSSEEAYKKLEEQVELLKEQLQRKDEQIESLQTQLSEASQRHDTVVMQISRMLEYERQPFWRRWRQRALPAPGDVMDMETDTDKES